MADTISQLSPRRLRIVIDGRTGAGKTSFGHELAAALRELGRSTLRASLDDFKHPWRDARERGYDRVTGEGYYRCLLYTSFSRKASARELRRITYSEAGSHHQGETYTCLLYTSRCV